MPVLMDCEETGLAGSQMRQNHNDYKRLIGASKPHGSPTATAVCHVTVKEEPSASKLGQAGSSGMMTMVRQSSMPHATVKQEYGGAMAQHGDAGMHAYQHSMTAATRTASDSLIDFDNMLQPSSAACSMPQQHAVSAAAQHSSAAMNNNMVMQGGVTAQQNLLASPFSSPFAGSRVRDREREFLSISPLISSRVADGSLPALLLSPQGQRGGRYGNFLASPLPMATGIDNLQIPPSPELDFLCNDAFLGSLDGLLDFDGVLDDENFPSRALLTPGRNTPARMTPSRRLHSPRVLSSMDWLQPPSSASRSGAVGNLENMHGVLGNKPPVMADLHAADDLVFTDSRHVQQAVAAHQAQCLQSSNTKPPLYTRAGDEMMVKSVLPKKTSPYLLQRSTATTSRPLVGPLVSNRHSEPESGSGSGLVAPDRFVSSSMVVTARSTPLPSAVSVPASRPSHLGDVNVPQHSMPPPVATYAPYAPAHGANHGAMMVPHDPTGYGGQPTDAMRAVRDGVGQVGGQRLESQRSVPMMSLNDIMPLKRSQSVDSTAMYGMNDMQLDMATDIDTANNKAAASVQQHARYAQHGMPAQHSMRQIVANNVEGVDGAGVGGMRSFAQCGIQAQHDAAELKLGDMAMSAGMQDYATAVISNDVMPPHHRRHPPLRTEVSQRLEGLERGASMPASMSFLSVKQEPDMGFGPAHATDEEEYAMLEDKDLLSLDSDLMEGPRQDRKGSKGGRPVRKAALAARRRVRHDDDWLPGGKPCSSAGGSDSGAGAISGEDGGMDVDGGTGNQSDRCPDDGGDGSWKSVLESWERSWQRSVAAVASNEPCMVWDQLRSWERYDENRFADPTRRRGNGGRQPACDPRTDPSIDPKRAERIIANRQSAARSKARQREHQDSLRRRNNMLRFKHEACSREIRFLTSACNDLHAENENLAARVQAQRSGNTAGCTNSGTISSLEAMPNSEAPFAGFSPNSNAAGGGPFGPFSSGSEQYSPPRICSMPRNSQH